MQSINPNRKTIDHRELERRSQDVILVKNPDSADFTIRWDGHLFTIPGNQRDLGDGKGQRRLPRYLAFRYMKKKTSDSFGNMMTKAVEAENAKRKKKGQEPLNLHSERPAFESRWKAQNSQAKENIFRSLFGGLVQEYGRDAIPDEPVRSNRDLSSAEEALFDELTGFTMPMTTAEEAGSGAIDEEVLAQAFEDDEPDTVTVG